MAIRPESTSVTLRRDLSALVSEFDEQAANLKFIGARAAPSFPVPEQAAGYPILVRENFLKQTKTERAPDGSYNRIVSEFGKGTYDTEEHGLEHRIDDRMRRRYSTFLSSEEAATRILFWQLVAAYEIRVAAQYSGAGMTNTNVATAWSTVASADPVEDIVIAAQKIEDQTGTDQSQMKLIIPRADYREMVRTDAFTDQLKYTIAGDRPQIIPAALAATVLGIAEVLVAKGAKDTAIEGETISMSQVWPSGVMYLGVLAEPGDPLEMPSAFRTFRWTADAPELPVVESYREENTRSDIIRYRDDTDEAATAEVDLLMQKITNT